LRSDFTGISASEYDGNVIVAGRFALGFSIPVDRNAITKTIAMVVNSNKTGIAADNSHDASFVGGTLRPSISQTPSFFGIAEANVDSCVNF